MSNTPSVRLPEDLSAWLKETAECTGRTQGEVVRLQLTKALAGKAKGLPRDLSTREGFGKR